MESLELNLFKPALIEQWNGHVAAADAQLVHIGAGGEKHGESELYRFSSPMRPADASELAWYLEQHQLWASEMSLARARRIEAAIPKWGQRLLAAVVSHVSARR